jgi:transcriptional regulator with XRE-family HTH domain
MSLKTRILAFLEKRGISKRQFYADTGLSNGTLDKVENIGSDKVEKIYAAYPEINLVWLITGKGEMFQKGNGTSDQKNGEANKPASERSQAILKANQQSSEELVKRVESLELDVQLLKQKFLKGKS